MRERVFFFCFSDSNFGLSLCERECERGCVRGQGVYEKECEREGV